MDSTQQMGPTERGVPSRQEFSAWGTCVLALGRDDSVRPVQDIPRMPDGRFKPLQERSEEVKQRVKCFNCGGKLYRHTQHEREDRYRYRCPSCKKCVTLDLEGNRTKNGRPFTIDQRHK